MHNDWADSPVSHFGLLEFLMRRGEYVSGAAIDVERLLEMYVNWASNSGRLELYFNGHDFASMLMILFGEIGPKDEFCSFDGSTFRGWQPKQD